MIMLWRDAPAGRLRVNTARSIPSVGENDLGRREGDSRSLQVGWKAKD